MKAFEKLNLIDTKHDPDATDRAKTIMVGKIFSRYIDMTLTVEVGGRQWVVTMRKRDGRSGNKRFYFAEVQPTAGDEEHEVADPAARQEGASVDTHATPAPRLPSSTTAPEAGREQPSTPSREPRKLAWMDAAGAMGRTNGNAVPAEQE